MVVKPNSIWFKNMDTGVRFMNSPAEIRRNTKFETIKKIQLSHIAVGKNECLSQASEFVILHSHD